MHQNASVLHSIFFTHVGSCILIPVNKAFQWLQWCKSAQKSKMALKSTLECTFPTDFLNLKKKKIIKISTFAERTKIPRRPKRYCIQTPLHSCRKGPCYSCFESHKCKRLNLCTKHNSVALWYCNHILH